MNLKSILYFSLFLTTLLFFSGCKKKSSDAAPATQVEDYKITTWNPIPMASTGTLLKLDFPSADIGYICGRYGQILKSTDGGLTFTSLASSVSQDLYAIDFINPFVGYAGGNAGTLIKTHDGGVTWTYVLYGSTADMRAMHFFNAHTGFIGGADGFLRKTINGGKTWTPIYSGTSTSTIESIHFINPAIGYLSGYSGYIAKTIDSGKTWTPVNTGITFALTASLSSIFFTSENTGYISGGNSKGTESYIIKTTDGGVTWVRLSPPNHGEYYSAIQFSDSLKGYAVGGTILGNNFGSIIKTTNGGTTWSTLYDTPQRLLDFQLVNSGLAFAVGYNTVVRGN